MNYIIKKVLNSSVVLVHDAKYNEFILLGKGIGYGKKTGEYICGSNDNQMFVPVENTKSKQFLELMDDIPVDILKFNYQRKKQLTLLSILQMLWLQMEIHMIRLSMPK